MVVELEHHSLSDVFLIPFLPPLFDILALNIPTPHGEPAMGFYKNFQYEYRLVAQHRSNRGYRRYWR